MKKRIATMLRRWAQRLDPRAVKPQLIINSRNVKRFKICKRVHTHDLEKQRRFYNRSRERILEILKQETIIEAAYEMAPLLEAAEVQTECGVYIELRAEFYFTTNEETIL